MRKYFSVLLLLSTFAVSFASEYKIFKNDTGREVSLTELTQQLAENDVVFFGELHDDSLLHSLKQDIFNRLITQNKNFVLGLESFSRDAQEAVNNYIKGDFSYEQLDAHSHLWSNYKEAYENLMNLARKNDIEVLATNVPIDISGLVAREGYEALNKLPASERRNYARVLNPLDNAYKTLFSKQMSDLTNGHSKQVDSLILERLYQAHSLKDDTMAETIFDYLEDNKSAKIFHINGDFHSKNHFGTYQKLELLNPRLNIASLSPVPLEPGQPLEWSFPMFSLGEYVIVYHRTAKSSVINDKADTSEYLSITKHQISFIFEPSARAFTVSDRITFNHNFGNNELIVSKDMKNIQIFANKKKIDYEVKKFDKSFNKLQVKSNAKVLDVVYIYDYPSVSGRLYYVNLPEYQWYPVVSFSEKSTFEINALAPKQMKFIAPAEATITPQKDDAIMYTWKSFGQTEGFSIIGDLYFTNSFTVDDVFITLYSFEEDFYLLDDYEYFIDQYFKDYKRYLGHFNYDTFSVVQAADNNYKSFGNMLLVSKDVFKNKEVFITPGVFGHDLVKIWIDSHCVWNKSGANWQEMLSNYIANYLWLEKKRAKDAYLWRKDALEDITAIAVPEIKPISEFTFAHDKFSAVNGYKIGGMLFYYIYNKVGEQKFFESLTSILTTNKSLSGDQFFAQLIAKTKVTEIKKFLATPYPIRIFIKDVEVKDGVTRLTVIQQNSDPYTFDLEIKVSKGDSFVETTYVIDKNETTLEFGLEATEVSIDPNYKLLRHLDNSENVYSLKRTFLENPLFIVPENSAKFMEIYNIGNTLKANGVAIDMLPYSTIANVEWQDKSLIYVGEFADNALFNTLKPYLPYGFQFAKNKFSYLGVEYSQAKYSLLINTKNPLAVNKSVSLWLWNNETELNNINSIFNHVAASWVILEYDGIAFKQVLAGNLIDDNRFPTTIKIK